jgi:hypothetical protein
MVFDVHLPLLIPRNGADRAFDHAQRVFAVATTGRHQIMIDLDALTQEA